MCIYLFLWSLPVCLSFFPVSNLNRKKKQDGTNYNSQLWLNYDLFLEVILMDISLGVSLICTIQLPECAIHLYTFTKGQFKGSDWWISLDFPSFPASSVNDKCITSHFLDVWSLWQFNPKRSTYPDQPRVANGNLADLRSYISTSTDNEYSWSKTSVWRREKYKLKS